MTTSDPIRLDGTTLIARPPAEVWAALIDPAVLKPLIPGCESMTGDPLRGYDIAVEQGVGTVKVGLTGRLDLSDLRPGEGCRIDASGAHPKHGRAEGHGLILLVPEGAGTRLGWDLTARLDGPLAHLPTALLTLAARRMADRFVEKFAAAMEGRAPARTGWLKGLLG